MRRFQDLRLPTSCVHSRRLRVTVGAAPWPPTPVTHLGNLCLGSPHPSGFVCLEVLVPDVRVSTHACVCVSTHARVCVPTGYTVRVPLNSSAVACPSGPCASSAADAERSSASGSGESPVIMRSRDAAVSWRRGVGTGHGEGVSVALGWSTECPVLAGNGRQQPWPEGTGDWGALQARLPGLQMGKRGRATARVSEGLRVKCAVGPLVFPSHPPLGVSPGGHDNSAGGRALGR